MCWTRQRVLLLGFVTCVLAASPGRADDAAVWSFDVDLSDDGSDWTWEDPAWPDASDVAWNAGAMEVTYPVLDIPDWIEPGPQVDMGDIDTTVYRYLVFDVALDAPFPSPLAAPVVCGLHYTLRDDVSGCASPFGGKYFAVLPNTGMQQVVLDMHSGPSDFNPAAWMDCDALVWYLRFALPYDASANPNGDWTNRTWTFDNIRITDTDPGAPVYPGVSHFGTVAPGHDRLQWPGNRGVDLGAQWQRTEQNVLAGFTNMYHGHVLDVGDPVYPYRMWFFGWADADCNPGFSGCDAIFLARGTDLDTWEVYSGSDTWDATRTPALWAPVVTAQGLLYDEGHNGDPSVVYHEGQYYMAYSTTGHNVDGIAVGGGGNTDLEMDAVMGAVSPDGIHWTVSDAPLVVYPAQIAGDVSLFPQAYSMHARPTLMFEDGYWRLWFDYWDPDNGTSVGYAETDSTDFLAGNFPVLFGGENGLLLQWPNPAVIKVGDRYYCFGDPPTPGFPLGWEGRQTCMAESPDGLTWTVVGHIPPDSDAPTNHVPEPALIQDGPDTWLVLYYACQIGGDPYNFRYDRIRYMKQLVAAEGEGEGEGGTIRPHSADWNGGADYIIDLSELLRLIQFYNSGNFHCAIPADATDDGYAPGTGDTACLVHSSDYAPTDWQIDLTELLRLIQFFNSDGYHPCPDDATEDGFCAGQS